MILEEIVESTKKRVEHLKQSKSEIVIRKEALQFADFAKKEPVKESFKKPFIVPFKEPFYFENSIINKSNSNKLFYICEVKKASPSRGILVNDFDYMKIAREYEAAGADAVSVLTESKFFKGKTEYLEEISNSITLPVLRKDFIIDTYQIYESKIIGADAILLICTILNEEKIKQFLEIADQLGLSVIVEVHNRQELDLAKKCGARIIGVNNRNLRDFTVDIDNSISLRECVDKTVIFISESGIKNRNDIIKMEENHVDAVLLGEIMVKSADKKAALQQLRGEIC